MKKCVRCKIIKEDSDFNFRYKDRKILSSACKECTSAYHKSWYERNSDKRRKQIHERRNSLEVWFSNYKKEKNLKCKICGEDRLPVLDFHHRIPEKKDGEIFRLVNSGNSKEKILEEIEKCDVLCSNCHRMLHFLEKE